MQRDEVVSDPAEPLVLVDSTDREIGHAPKAECHAGDGILHRAFSIHLVNPDGEILLQQRSADKLLWPLYWSNSCCSHPRKGESIDEALQRRMQEELGMQCPLTFLYKFQYQATYRDIGSENELCSVYLGHYDGEVNPNASEIADVRHCSPAGIDALIRSEPGRVTPWFVSEWRPLQRDHAELLRARRPRAISGK